MNHDQTDKATDFWNLVQRQLLAMQQELGSAPGVWHEHLQQCLAQGGYLALEISAGQYGLLGSTLHLVNAQTGERIELSMGVDRHD